mgnify:CR=1 FL=1
MSSSKNRLQEYYQKRGLRLPVYDTTQTGAGLFQSRVTLSTGGTFTGEPSQNKRAAELSAATVALGYLPAEGGRHSALPAAGVPALPASTRAVREHLLPPAAFTATYPRVLTRYDPMNILHDRAAASSAGVAGGSVPSGTLLLVDLDTIPRLPDDLDVFNRVQGFISEPNRDDGHSFAYDIQIVNSDKGSAVAIFIAMAVARVHTRYSMVYILSASRALTALEDIVGNVKHLRTLEELESLL